MRRCENCISSDNRCRQIAVDISCFTASSRMVKKGIYESIPIERKFCFATYRGIDNWLITDWRTRVLSFTSNFCIGNEGYGLNCCEKRSLQIARMDSASRELEAITVSDHGIREYRECARVVWLSRDIMHFSGKNVHSRAFYIFAWNVKNTIVAIEDHNFVT